MCLGIPGKIIEINQKNDMPMGRIDFGGLVKEACLAYVPDARVGDYVLIHVGFAISIMDEEEAMATLKLIKEVTDFESELDGDGNRS